MSTEEDREALIDLIDGCVPDDIPGYRQRYTDKAAEAILAAGFHRTPAPAPSDDVRALAGRARDVAKYQTYGDIDNLLRLLADALDAATETIEQLTTDLDARFEHSDHTAAKYYQRMRAAEKEMHARELHHFEEEQRSAGLTSRLDRVHKLTQPWADRIDLEQVGTHSPDCHTYHRDCLILTIRHTITNGDTQ